LLFVATARRLHAIQVVALSLIIGGGVGNLIDRVFNHGAVIDFLNLGVGSLRTGIFNAADVQILTGIGLLLLQSLQSVKPFTRPAD
jgi:signal peptidase II